MSDGTSSSPDPANYRLSSMSDAESAAAAVSRLFQFEELRLGDGSAQRRILASKGRFGGTIPSLQWRGAAVLHRAVFEVGFIATNPVQAIRKMVQAMWCGAPEPEIAEALVDELLAREALDTTMAGDRFVIPHARTQMASRLMFGYFHCSSPIKWTNGEKPVEFIACCIAPKTKPGDYLACISLITRSFLRGIIPAVTSPPTLEGWKDLIVQKMTTLTPRHSEIANRAAEIWRERGQPSGQDDAIWHAAESQLQALLRPQLNSGGEKHP